MNNKVHVIIDFMHIYYKYFFQLKAGRMPRLSAPIEWNGTVIEKDTTLIYYSLKDIEKIRKEWEKNNIETVISVCMDSKSSRNEDDDSQYKAGRIHNLTEENHKEIELIADILKEAGHNVYKIPGYEADDLVKALVDNHKDKFLASFIYTNDKDLLVNISEDVGVARYKAKVGYTKVTMKNYESYLEAEYGVFIPYNALGFFLSTVGDSADNIKGINKFGKAAFKKLIDKMNNKYKIDWSKCGDYEELRKVKGLSYEFLDENQIEELNSSFDLVSNIVIKEIDFPNNISTKEKREEAYGKYKMLSLID